jgi:hypothetical protein
VDDCSKCKGTGKIACRGCKAPWHDPAPESVFERQACSICGESGWVLASVRMPCPECYGMGAVLKPAKTSTKPATGGK